MSDASRRSTDFLLSCYEDGILGRLVPQSGEVSHISNSPVSKSCSDDTESVVTALQLSSDELMLGGTTIDREDPGNQSLFHPIVHLVDLHRSDGAPFVRRFELNSIRTVVSSTHISRKNLIAIGSSITRLLLWDPTTHEEILLNQAGADENRGYYHGLLHHPIESPTHLFCAHAHPHRCELWDLEVSKLIISLPQPGIGSLSLDPFRNQLIVGIGGTGSCVAFFDSRSLEMICSTRAMDQNQLFGDIEQVIFREESRNQIVVGGYVPGRIDLHICDVRFMSSPLLSWKTHHPLDLAQLSDVPDHDLIVSVAQFEETCISAWRATDQKEMWTHESEFASHNLAFAGSEKLSFVAAFPFLKDYEEFVGMSTRMEMEDEEERIAFLLDHVFVMEMEEMGIGMRIRCCGEGGAGSRSLICLNAFALLYLELEGTL